MRVPFHASTPNRATVFGVSRVLRHFRLARQLRTGETDIIVGDRYSRPQGYCIKHATSVASTPERAKMTGTGAAQTAATDLRRSTWHCQTWEFAGGAEGIFIRQ